MGDMGDYFRDVRKIRQEKRASNREASAEILRNHGISFLRRNIDAHLIVAHGGKVVDFWPGTGRWQVRGGIRGFGVMNLVREVSNA